MPEYEINGILVKFPFEAYDIQLQYMGRIIAALKSKSHALLESPTGTGKTLCLLCATLAWREWEITQANATAILKHSESVSDIQEFENNKDESNSSAKSADRPHVPPAPKIYYTSRTHSQLTQVIHQLRKTGYSVSTTAIGSRDHLCVHEDVRHLKAPATQRKMCKNMVSNKKCQYHLRSKDIKLRDGIYDIEDIMRFGEKRNACPFFIARNSADYADILTMPYNYIVDPIIRKQQKIDLNNSIVIFDECHNLESVCIDTCSIELSEEDLDHCIEEITFCLNQAPNKSKSAKPATKTVTTSPSGSFKLVFDTIMGLKDEFSKLEISKSNSNPLANVRPGEFMYDLFGRHQITWNSAKELLDAIDEATDLMHSDTRFTKRMKGGLHKLHAILSKLYLTDMQVGLNRFMQFFKVALMLEPRRNKQHGDQRVVHFWCLHASVAMQNILKSNVHSLILTSGTLSPINSFIQELGVQFTYTLENAHVIGSDQVMLAILARGPNNVALSSTYNSRSDPTYQRDLGMVVSKVMSKAPEGALGFFPSYVGMDTLINAWKKQGLFDGMERVKRIFLEPKDRKQLVPMIEEYVFHSYCDPKIQPPGIGSALFAVCRGKVSEGIDFADYKGRLVMVMGVPYPLHTDLRIILKRAFLDERYARAGSTGVSGQAWYEQQATRAINQAVGRVIRHRHDYGAILLLDERFEKPAMRMKLSKWLHPFVRTFSSLNDLLPALSQFFGTNQSRRGLLVESKAPPIPGQTPIPKFDDQHEPTSSTNYISSWSAKSKFPTRDGRNQPRKRVQPVARTKALRIPESNSFIEHGMGSILDRYSKKRSLLHPLSGPDSDIATNSSFVHSDLQIALSAVDDQIPPETWISPGLSSTPLVRSSSAQLVGSSGVGAWQNQMMARPRSVRTSETTMSLPTDTNSLIPLASTNGPKSQNVFDRFRRHRASQVDASQPMDLTLSGSLPNSSLDEATGPAVKRIKSSIIDTCQAPIRTMVPATKPDLIPVPIPSGSTFGNPKPLLDADKFREMVKLQLGENASKFSRAISRYKLQTLSVDGMMDEVFKLLADAKSAELLRGFMLFIPGTKRRLWQRRLGTILQLANREGNKSNRRRPQPSRCRVCMSFPISKPTEHKQCKHILCYQCWFTCTTAQMNLLDICPVRDCSKPIYSLDNLKSHNFVMKK